MTRHRGAAWLALLAVSCLAIAAPAPLQTGFWVAFALNVVGIVAGGAALALIWTDPPTTQPARCSCGSPDSPGIDHRPSGPCTLLPG